MTHEQIDYWKYKFLAPELQGRDSIHVVCSVMKDEAFAKLTPEAKMDLLFMVVAMCR